MTEDLATENQRIEVDQRPSIIDAQVGLFSLQIPWKVYNPNPLSKTGLTQAAQNLEQPLRGDLAQTRESLKTNARNIEAILEEAAQFDVEKVAQGQDLLTNLASRLSPPLLLSLAATKTSKLTAYFALKKAMPGFITKVELEELQEGIGFNDLLNPAGENPKYLDRLQASFALYRAPLSWVLAEEICQEAGLDLRRDFLDPLRLLGLKIGYSSSFPGFASRAAGACIPVGIRSLEGKIRFGQMTQAAGDFYSALGTLVLSNVCARSYYLQSLTTAASRATGLELGFENEHILVEEQAVPFLSQLKAKLDKSQFIQTALKITSLEGLEKYFSNLSKKATDSTDYLSRFLTQLSIALIDPAISEAFTFFPREMEAFFIRRLTIPYSSVYHLNQKLTIMNIKRIEAK